MKKNKPYLKNYILFLLVFIAVTVLFHFAAGEQLYYRQTATGMEEVWTGKHYNRLVVAAWMMFTLLYVYSAWRFENGKWDLIFTTAAAFKKYGFLRKIL